MKNGLFRKKALDQISSPEQLNDYIRVDAKASGRNDVMIGDRKVSGNAFYHVSKRGQMWSGRSIVHGTMLYDTNMENMVGAITPSDEKLVSKGVESVRQLIDRIAKVI